MQSRIETHALDAASTNEITTEKTMISWEKKYRNLKKIENVLLNPEKLEAIKSALLKKDMDGITLKDFLYRKAEQHPHILYHMLCKHLVHKDDFDKLQGMQAKLRTLFSDQDIPENIKEKFHSQAASTGKNPHPLAAFMHAKTHLPVSEPAVRPTQCAATLYPELRSNTSAVEKLALLKVPTHALVDYKAEQENNISSRYEDLPVYEMSFERAALKG